MAFREIPIVSLSGWADAGGDRPAFAERLRAICHEVGFFQLVDHGVDRAFVEEYFTALRTFFTLPDSIKARIDKAQSPWFRGWERVGSELTDLSVDYREQIDVWTELPPRPRDIEPAYLRLDGPNQWLDDTTLPGFRSVVERFQSEMGAIADQLMAAMCVGLGLPPDHLDKRFGERRSSLVKLIHYPPTPPGEAGVNAHHDAGFLTLLWQHGVAGLQALNEDGDWIDVPASNDAIVVNLGEILQSMTGNYFVATTHRVITGQERYSSGYFHGPDLRTGLEPLPLDHRFTEAVAASPRHRGAGFMAKHDELLGGERGTGSTSAACYGEQLWNYFVRSYPDLVRRHHPDVAMRRRTGAVAGGAMEGDRDPRCGVGSGVTTAGRVIGSVVAVVIGAVAPASCGDGDTSATITDARPVASSAPSSPSPAATSSSSAALTVAPIRVEGRGEAPVSVGEPIDTADLNGRIVFDDFEDVYTMRPDGSDVHTITARAGTEFDGAWSPDGQFVAYRDSRRGVNEDDEIYIARADGTDARNLTNDPANDWGPDWSPDGEWIIFNSDRERGVLGGYMVRPDGSDLRRLPIDVWVEYPTLSPDGTRIAFMGHSGRDYDIYVADMATGSTTRLTDASGSDGWPVWSPDGTTIAFASERDDCTRTPDGQDCWHGDEPGEHHDIWIMGADGSNQRRVTPESGHFVTWSPDGRYLLISGRALYVVRPDGTGRLELRADGFPLALGGIPDWTE